MKVPGTAEVRVGIQSDFLARNELESTFSSLKIRSQIRDNGTWNSLRVPLTILIAAVFTFLFASQQEAYESLLKYLSILTVSVPMALKFFAMFEKTPKSN
ncbi:hypothetical protein [Dyadobacter sp. MSC1_007]|uniref:hypothetical protein n=1 Tax=Dyadobacter sp. MSC1_007 TaxID=2909264 RepID=UPI00202E5800|nr:hypothetical protein [Dyadobacter sp. MSC1_007]